MRHIDFLREFGELPHRPLYLLVGPEIYPVGAILGAIAGRTRARVRRFWGPATEPQEVVGALGAGDLFSPGSVCAVLALDHCAEGKSRRDCKKKLGPWASLLRLRIPRGSALVLHLEREDSLEYLVSKAKLDKEELAKRAWVVYMPHLEEKEFRAWVMKELRRGGVPGADPKAFQALLGLLPRELTPAKAELAKLVACLGGRSLDSDECFAVLSPHGEGSVFRALDRLVEGRPKEQMDQLLREAADGGASFLAMASASFANLALAKLGALRLIRPSWKAKQLSRAARGTLGDILGLLEGWAQAEERAKSGWRARTLALCCLLRFIS